MSDRPARYHAIERVSPKGPGHKYVGTCWQCGKTNLTLADAGEICENVSGLTESESMIMAIDGQQEVPGHRQMKIETSRKTLKEASIDLLKATGWKPGDKFSFHSVSELMVALAVNTLKGEIGCDYPSCGCCADAACEDAIKQHPDLGGTPSPAAEQVERRAHIERNV